MFCYKHNNIDNLLSQPRGLDQKVKQYFTIRSRLPGIEVTVSQLPSPRSYLSQT